MGIYNEYYKKYYLDVRDRKEPNGYRGSKYKPGQSTPSKRISSFPIMINVFGRGYHFIFTTQAVIVIVLIMMVIGVNMYKDPVALKIYDRCLHYIDTGIFENDEAVEKKALGIYNDIKSLFLIDERKEEFISQNYIMPVDKMAIEDVEILDGEMLITTSGKESVRPAYKGVIKKVESNDNEILINHGDGVEIRYIGVNDILVKAGDQVTTDSILGGVSDNGNVGVEVYYMGNRLDPLKCFDMEGV